MPGSFCTCDYSGFCSSLLLVIIQQHKASITVSPGESFIMNSTLTHPLMGPDPCFTPPAPMLSPRVGCDMVKDKGRYQLADGHVGYEGVSRYLEHSWPPQKHQRGKSGLKRE